MFGRVSSKSTVSPLLPPPPPRSPLWIQRDVSERDHLLARLPRRVPHPEGLRLAGHGAPRPRRLHQLLLAADGGRERLYRRVVRDGPQSQPVAVAVTGRPRQRGLWPLTWQTESKVVGWTREAEMLQGEAGRRRAQPEWRAPWGGGRGKAPMFKCDAVVRGELVESSVPMRTRSFETTEESPTQSLPSVLPKRCRTDRHAVAGHTDRPGAGGAVPASQGSCVASVSHLNPLEKFPCQWRRPSLPLLLEAGVHGESGQWQVPWDMTAGSGVGRRAWRGSSAHTAFRANGRGSQRSDGS